MTTNSSLWAKVDIDNPPVKITKCPTACVAPTQAVDTVSSSLRYVYESSDFWSETESTDDQNSDFRVWGFCGISVVSTGDM